ncbi:MAG TPA: PDZ domain-containing protein [Gemmatimonas sp.]|uniref:PDZ domain-containing protein n=1 Tax=Gemmatimonas sp. TaxID=1962908 RepID=UPI002EDB071D
MSPLLSTSPRALRVSRPLLWALPFLLALPGAMPFGVAEAQVPDASMPRRTILGPMLSTMWTRSADRAVLGVTLGAGSSADTAGVRLEEVDANGPAAKAGLQAGDVLTEINGISLKVAKEDAEDLAMTGLAQRRLQRALAKAKPGDEVRLQYRRGGASKALTFKTVSAADLERSEVRRVSGAVNSTNDMRGRIGVTIGGAGTSRDTLGLFVSAVTAGGPAELAGVVEGERVAAVNGVDVRIPREDLDDQQTRSARIDRFVREVQKVAPGSPVTLRVYGNGKYREVAVKAVKASELPASGFNFELGDGNGDRRVRVITPPAQEFMDGFRQQLREGIRDMDVRIPGPPGTIRVITRRSSAAL